MFDSTGKFALKIVSAIIGGIIAVVAYFTIDAFIYYITHGYSFKNHSINKWKLAWEFAWGAVCGAFVPTNLSKKGAALISAAINAMKGTLQRMTNLSSQSIGSMLGGFLVDFLIGYVTGFICGEGCKPKMKLSISFKNTTPYIKYAKTTYKATPNNIKTMAKAMASFLKASLISNIGGWAQGKVLS